MAKETFAARIMKRDRTGGYYPETETLHTSVASAVHATTPACKAGRYVRVQSDYTSDGTYHANHRGRTMATCEARQWLVEGHTPLTGARRKRKRATACAVGVGKRRAPKRLRTVRR